MFTLAREVRKQALVNVNLKSCSIRKTKPKKLNTSYTKLVLSSILDIYNTASFSP